MRCAPAVLALALVLPLPAMAGAVQVQPGETLSEIADRLGVSVQRLIEINKIKDPNHVEAGTQLKLPKGISSSRGTSAKAGTTSTVTVGEGETLSAIADRHGVPVSTLMALNSLKNPNHVEAGQVLKLKGSASATPKPTSFSYTPGVTQHVVRKGESLSAIARGYGVPVNQLVALNAISDPNNVQAGSTLKLKGHTPAAPRPSIQPAAVQPAAVQPQATAALPKSQPQVQARPIAAAQPRPAVTAQPKPAPATVAVAPRPATAPVQDAATGKSDWRAYGPVQVDWTSWQPMGGSMVAATLNAKGEALYTSINCGARKINATNGAGQWGTWNDPVSAGETKLVNDFCSRRGS
ncbi:MAG: LysM peptidoglycan-binding domain-containing protein [Cyanobacteriota bacterium]|nr:LysM peptidoglycan-binding domain-containing protein [Cyanobacteriota bacterium]